MGISLKTRKMLWGRSANRCAFPDCRKELVMDATETDDESIVGEECHIIAREDNGPRGDASYPLDKRDKYDNLILLCNIHHKVIDDQPNTYTVEILKNIKSEHIRWVNSALNIDQSKQHDDELYSTYVEKWAKMADLDNWEAWSSWVLGSGQPQMSVEIEKQLEELKRWLFSRIWPKRYPDLEDAFENFRKVLNDFLMTFHEHSIQKGNLYDTEKFYKIDEWDPTAYNRLFKEFRYHVALVQDLMLELTRAANYVCDKVRQYLLSNFRLEEGLLLVTSGPYADFSFRTHRVEYRGSERTSKPYPGLEQFTKIREKRDMCFGGNDDSDETEDLGDNLG